MTSRDITFRPDAHLYLEPDGTIVPSVTGILSAVGVSVDFNALAQTSARLGDAIQLKRDIGSALHADAHAYDDHDLEWSTVDPRVRPYLDAWVVFRENSGLRPVARERLVYHPVYRYAGTLDGIFETGAGRLVLPDLKTGDPDDAGCQFQTAAYLEAWRADHPERAGEPVERWGVQLVPGQRVPYRVHKYDAWDDFQKFLAFLTTYRHQSTRRRAA